MRMDYRLEPPDQPEASDEVDPDCGLCGGWGRVDDEDEDGKRSVECPCVERLREAREDAAE